MENMLSTKEVAEILGISCQAVNRLCNRGTLACLWVGGARVFIRHKILLYKMDPIRMKMTRAIAAEIITDLEKKEEYR